MSRARSGLGSVKRNWSDASISEAPYSSQDIPWPPTPPQPPPKKLSGQEQRMKDIQDALAGHPSNSEKSAPFAPPLNPSNALNKRSSPDAAHSSAPAPKKARQLPPNWEGKDPLTRSGFGKNAISSNTDSSGTSSTTKAPVSGAAGPSKTKVASVFLSQEQTRILKLVEEGNSVFYTGSAGQSMSFLHLVFQNLTAYRHWEICSSAWNYKNIAQETRKNSWCCGNHGFHWFLPSLYFPQVSNNIFLITGIAACNIGGVTIHSFAGIGLGIESAEELTNKIKKNKKASARWLRTKVLIIDEG